MSSEAGPAPCVLASLVDMFPALGPAVVGDVLEQCGNNQNVALEQLLRMTDGAKGAAPVPTAPAPLRTHQAIMATLLPGSSPPTAPAHLSVNQNHPPNAPANGALDLGGGGLQASVELNDLYPWLDTGQADVEDGMAVAAVAALPGHQPGQLAAAASCRAWWPFDPLSLPNQDQGDLAATRGTVQSAVPMPVALGPSCPSAPGSWSASDALPDTSNTRTPPESPPQPPRSGSPSSPARLDGEAAAGGADAPSSSPPTTPLPSADGCQRPGTAAPTCATDAGSDDELAALMPHLAHCLASPSPSGTTSPVPAAATTPAAEAVAPPTDQRGDQRASPGGAGDGDGDCGFDAAELVETVGFYCGMFPQLKSSVVGGVLEQYGKAKALEQLIMLSQCVDHAEEAAVAAAARTPDPASWASCGSGSGSDDEGGGGAGYAYVGGIGQGRPALSAEQLAAQLGMAPADLAAALASPREPAAPRPLTPEDDAGLSAEEKLEVLKAEFGGIAAAEVEGALAVCDGGLFRAAELLRTIAADDEAHDMSAAAAAASVPAAAALPPHVRPKVAHLARRFPDASEESLQMVLQLCGGDLAAARRTLRDNGHDEVEAPPSTPPSPAQPPSSLPQPVPLPTSPAVPAPAPLAGSGGVGSGGAGGLLGGPSVAPPPLQGQSLSEATYARNQAVYEEERAKAGALQQAYRRCFELAAQHHARGNADLAADLANQGRRYKELYDEERKRASRRISTRINAAGAGGALPVVPVDLHGLHVDEALAMVASGVRNLPQSIPGGLVVRYITGRGLHSEGGAARIKPRVIELLGQLGVPYREGPGWVEATLRPGLD